ncbi:hypothetical protein MTYM_01810 [Methylococcales bacterium]|nr:hypothetical protein MTYM_01810 [Methylococcales bacterium]
MKKFHLMQVIPPYRHKSFGCTELIETIKWGLEQLGYEVSHAINSYYPDCRNIIFVAQVLPIEFMKNFPDDTIIYNAEQMRGFTGDYIRPEMHFYAQHFEVWDYKAENLDSWASVENTRNIKVVPIGYAPILTRLVKPAYQDIDILIYGMTGENRLKAFDLLSAAGFTTVFACGLYGEARDNLIERSKIVLNVTLYQTCQQFEIVRVSYLLANKKAVVSVLDENTLVEDEMKSCIKFSTLETLVEDCRQLIDNDTMRTELENLGFEMFRRHDIRDILKTALTD